MKYAIIADLHISLYQSEIGKAKDSPFSIKLNSIMKVWNNIITDIIEKKINDMIILGDIFHTKSIIHTQAQSLLLDFIRNYKNFNFYIINGNHDMSEKGEDAVSALKCLDAEPNVMMMHETKHIDNILFVPWGKNMVNDIKNGEADYLCSHLGLNEAKLSSGISIVSDIGLRDLKQYKRALLGHYHKPQELSNVIYIGSTIQLTRGEKNEIKRFIILDTVEDTVESIPTYGYRKYQEYIITEENKEEIIKFAKESKENGDFVQIIKQSNVDTDDICDEFTVIDKTETDIINRGLTISMTMREKFQRYLTIKEIKKDDWSEYENLAIDVINSVVEEN